MCECGAEELQGGCFNPSCGTKKTPKFSIALPIKPRCGECFLIHFTEVYGDEVCIIVNEEEYYITIQDLVQATTSIYSRLLMDEIERISSVARYTIKMGAHK